MKKVLIIFLLMFISLNPHIAFAIDTDTKQKLCELVSPELSEVCEKKETSCDTKQYKLFITKIRDKSTDLASVTTDCSKKNFLAIYGEKNEKGKLTHINTAYLFSQDKPDNSIEINFDEDGYPEQIIYSEKTKIKFKNFNKNQTVDIEVKYENNEAKSYNNIPHNLDNDELKKAAKIIKNGEKSEDDYYESSCLDTVNGALDEKCAPPSYISTLSLIMNAFGCGESIIGAVATGGLFIAAAAYSCISFSADAINYGVEALCLKPSIALENVSDLSSTLSVGIECVAKKGKCLEEIINGLIEKKQESLLDELTSNFSNKKEVNCGFKNWCESIGSFSGVSRHPDKDCWCTQSCIIRCDKLTSFSYEKLEKSCTSNGGKFTKMDSPGLNEAATCVGPHGWEEIIKYKKSGLTYSCP